MPGTRPTRALENAERLALQGSGANHPGRGALPNPHHHYRRTRQQSKATTQAAAVRRHRPGCPSNAPIRGRCMHARDGPTRTSIAEREHHDHSPLRLTVGQLTMASLRSARRQRAHAGSDGCTPRDHRHSDAHSATTRTIRFTLPAQHLGGGSIRHHGPTRKSTT